MPRYLVTVEEYEPGKPIIAGIHVEAIDKFEAIDKVKQFLLTGCKLRAWSA